MENYLLENAQRHSNVCRNLLEHGRLADALEYCANQRVEPPQCMPAADSVHADRLQTLAINMLSDYGWWAKRLKILAARDAARLHIQIGAPKSTGA